MISCIASDILTCLVPQGENLAEEDGEPAPQAELKVGHFRRARRPPPYTAWLRQTFKITGIACRQLDEAKRAFIEQQLTAKFANCLHKCTAAAASAFNLSITTAAGLVDDGNSIDTKMVEVTSALATQWKMALLCKRTKKTRVLAQPPESCLKCQQGGGCNCPVPERLAELGKSKRFSAGGIASGLKVTTRQLLRRKSGKLPSLAAIDQFDRNAEQYLSAVHCDAARALEIDTSLTSQLVRGQYEGYLHFVKQDHDFALKRTGCCGAIDTVADDAQSPSFFIPGLAEIKHLLVRGILPSGQVGATEIRSFDCCVTGSAINTHSATEPRCDACAAFRGSYLKTIASAQAVSAQVCSITSN